MPQTHAATVTQQPCERTKFFRQWLDLSNKKDVAVVRATSFLFSKQIDQHNHPPSRCSGDPERLETHQSKSELLAAAFLVVYQKSQALS